MMIVTEHPFEAIVLMCARLGVTGIDKLPGCWEHQIDDQWWVAVNPHLEDVRSSRGLTVPPFSAYVEYNGWPAGIIQPLGGEFAVGEGANTQTFIAACESAKEHRKR